MSRSLTYTHFKSYDGINQVADRYCCETGYRLWSVYESLLESPFSKAEKNKIFKQLQAKCEDNHVISHKHVGNGKPKGLFAGTLTMSTSDDISEDDMVVAIGKIMSQKTCPVKRYAWYLEYTKANVPHIHFIYETDGGGRIHQKVFKRYWKNWDESVRQGAGFRGGFHKPVESEVAYTEYIAKDANIKSENKWELIV